MMRNVVILWCLFFIGHEGLSQQVQMRLDSNQFLIGDQTDLYIQFRGLQIDEVVASLKEYELPDGIEILSNDSLRLLGNNIVEERLRIAFFDTGRLVISPITVRRITDTVYSNSIPVFVHGVMSQSPELAPIKPIIREATHWLDFWRYYLAISLALLAYFMFKWYQKYKAKKSTVVVDEIVVPPTAYEVASRALHDLKSLDLPSQNLHKEHMAALSLIVREYIEQVYHVRATESTTREILVQLENKKVDQNIKEILSTGLSEIDQIKYAKKEIDTTGVLSHHERLRSMIEEIHSRQNSIQ